MYGYAKVKNTNPQEEFKPFKFNATFVGKFYYKHPAGFQTIVKSFNKKIVFDCPHPNRECEEVMISEFIPEVNSFYYVTTAIEDLNPQYELNDNLYLHFGVSKFNDAFNHCIFWTKSVIFILAIIIFMTFWVNTRPLKTDGLKDFEQPLVKILGAMLIVYSEPISSYNPDSAPSIRLISLVLEAAFYTYCFYFWTAMMKGMAARAEKVDKFSKVDIIGLCICIVA